MDPTIGGSFDGLLVVWSSLYIKLDMNYKRTANEFAAENRIYKKTRSAKFIQSTEK